MKRLIILAISTLIMGLAAAYAGETGYKRLPSGSMAMNDSLEMSSEARLQLEDEALEGSADAANELVMYYSIYVEDNIKRNYWAQIGAENGGEKNAFNYANILYKDKSNRANILRALFWAKRATPANANAAYKSLLADIKKDVKAFKGTQLKKKGSE